MKPIKFRLWDKKYSMFDYSESPDIFISTNGEVYEKEERTFAMTTYIEYEKRDHYAVMQYTGLKDRYGTEIYEGDVVIGINRINESEMEQEVTFLNGCFMFGNWNAHEYFNKHTEIFIVGNIYENKELLSK